MTQCKRGPGRPRLQDEACVRRLGVPMTETDWGLLAGLTQRLSNERMKPVSRQEVIRILIRQSAGQDHE